MVIEMFTQKTPNADETLNGMISEDLPKLWDCGLQKLEFDVYDAVASFNYRKKSAEGIFVI